ncbi:Nif3-like dinuclear metal center hexameric protein [Mycoplasma mycoides subsp. capri]|uniref:Nif3-like dinuclear metal center hexameric protein n=1 Tax=Mycoplasma mycoides TaxID=2102 RepID=UPI00223EB6D9|nr:Nif3-like dinuclear metal center hexameric protein [Mycoplasma mycoides]QVJ96732.1 Nif3-like dinuclear metal center hexameric protein [Mycoplasma mycoides subsp. capri]QVJ97625.1 Nif3-like dinuclear metal center hexameric protein [Mycoplasma mycoides subsp. capri]QVK00617.1 Nif3-like dinuclear metal center hexameric protein [Mycoplasma mycoides subsp. capri]QVK01505.1 Nif3-like dinuclear metal center hexameric protein [Mycoplasma mycoides subsp. capri]
MLLDNIISYLNQLFNPKKASNWDRVGFQFDYKKLNNINISKVLVCLDLTNDCLEFAISNQIQLIITRHPFIFNELKLEKKNPNKKQMIKKLNKHKILVFSIHTNYDSSIKQNLLEILNKKLKINSFKKYGKDKESNLFYLDQKITVNDLINDLKEVFSLNQIRLNSNISLNTKIKNFYLTSGSGASTMIENSLKNCTFITGEVKWDQWIYANSNNVNLIEIGHYAENHFIDDLKNKLEIKFKDIKIFSYDIKNQFIEK